MEQSQIIPWKWKSIGPGGGGWWTTIKVHPFDHNIVYVGCDVGGVYRSQDSGASWKIINKGLIHYPVDDLLIDHQNPETIYAATNGGVYRSQNSGETWERKRNGFPAPIENQVTAPISCLHMHPTNPNIVYAGMGLARSYYPKMPSFGKIYYTTDQGENWQVLNKKPDIHSNANIFSIASDPSDPDTMYIATNYGLYKSTDSGLSWTLKSTGLPYLHTRQVIVNPVTPQVLYVSLWYDDTTGANASGVYKSTNGGDAWYPVNNGLGSNPMDIYWRLVMNPNKPDTLYVGNQQGAWNTNGVFKTTNGGALWKRVTTNNVDPGWIDFWGDNIQCLAISPSKPSTLYYGTSGIVAKTQNGGGAWDQVYTKQISPGRWKGRGLENTYPYAMAVDHLDPNRIYVGTLDVSLLISEDGGKSYRKVNKSLTHEGSDVFSITIDPGAPNTIYMTDGELVAKGNYGNVWKSTNHGNTWQALSKKTPYAGLPYGKYRTLAIDTTSPVNSRVLYTACAKESTETQDGGVFKSMDGGQTWTQMNNGLPSNAKHVASLVVDPFDSQRIYAGVPVWWGHGKGGFFVSNNGGVSWSQKAFNLGSVWKVIADPNQQGLIYAITSSFWASGKKGGVFKSTNSGQTFIEMTVGMPNSSKLWVNDLSINPFDPNMLLAVTHHGMGDVVYYAGMFVSYDQGGLWRPCNFGMTTLNLDSVYFDPTTPGRAFVGSSGNGLFVTTGIR